MKPKINEKILRNLGEIRTHLKQISLDEVSDAAADHLAKCWDVIQGLEQELSGEGDALVEKKAMPSIALVDDDPDVQRMLAFMLHRKGFQVTSFFDPQDALNQLVEIRPDVIILDLMMPNMTGFEFLEKFKSLRPKLPNVRIIVGSARSFESDRLTVLRSGASDFVAKPYSLDELVLRINNLIAA